MSNFGKRSEFKLIIQLFYEGKTELDYLQKFIQQQKKTTLVKLNKIYTNQNPVTLAKEVVKKYNDIKMSKREIWVIFDDDGRIAEVRDAINLIKQSGKDIYLAYMKPCIEIWPLLHNGIDNVNSQSEVQSRLESIMPSYRHEGNPYFDLSKMPNYEQAVRKARQWEVSLDGEQEYNASKFAGIYKLTENIKNI